MMSYGEPSTFRGDDASTNGSRARELEGDARRAGDPHVKAQLRQDLLSLRAVSPGGNHLAPSLADAREIQARPGDLVSR